MDRVSDKPKGTKLPQNQPSTAQVRHASLNLENTLVGGRYRVIRPIGSGSFGDIYLGLCIKDGIEVAIKVEASDAKYPQLMYEAKVYKQLRLNPGFPKLLHFGTEKRYNAMVIELLGPSLEELFNLCKRRFSLKTVLMLIDQLLLRLEVVHEAGFIHRDVKPDNFLMGLGQNVSQLYLIDFGLSKRYMDSETHQHIPYRKDRNLTGTVRYASMNAQMGVEQSRRDDMESMSYCVMYFILGKLPWQGITAANKKQKYERILEKKTSISIQTLCRGLPTELSIFLRYVRNLRFKDPPDHKYLRQLFRILYRSLNLHYDYIYDWTQLQQQQKERLRRDRELENEKIRERHRDKEREYRTETERQPDAERIRQTSTQQAEHAYRRQSTRYERDRMIGDGSISRRK